jgi:hypothetical protein
LVAVIAGTNGAAGGSTADAGAGLAGGRAELGGDDFGAALADDASGAKGLKTISEMMTQATKVLVQEWWSADVVLII